MEHPVVIGKFGSAHGVRGWIKLYSYTDPISNITQYKQWWIQCAGAWEVLTPEQFKPHGNGLLVKLKGCETPEAAKHYTNTLIHIERHELPMLADDEYYWEDLVGCEVYTPEGVLLGKVDHLFHTGSNDVIVVGDSEHQKRHLIPQVSSIVLNINLDKKQIIADWDLD